MKQLKQMIKTILPKTLLRQIQNLRRARRSLRPIAKRECNICGFSGWFGMFGRPPRLDAQCPNCLSLERHRLMMLAIDGGLLKTEPKNVLHFAPEPVLEKLFRVRWGGGYQTADLFQPADLKLNLEAIELPDASVDLIIANHVLEHVDDRRASQELSRILRPNGLLLCMVPIVEGWKGTYENPAITDDEGRMLHFGQEDHVRFYGSNFRDRIAAGGFTLMDEVTAEGDAVIRHGLVRGEKVFVFQKAA